MQVEVVPCDAYGREYSEQDDMFVDVPEELVGKALHFNVKLMSARGLPNRFTDIYCRYSIYNDADETRTEMIPDTTNPNFNHTKMYSFTPVSHDLVKYLHDGCFVIQVWGTQKTRKSAALFAKGKTTKEMLNEDRSVLAKSSHAFQMNGRVVDPQKQSIVVELLLMKKQQARLQQRVDGLKKLIERAENLHKRKVPTSILKDVFNATTPESADKVMALLEGK